MIDKFTDSDDVRRMLLLLFEEVLQERLGYDLIRDVQVLTPTHKGPLGTVELNIELQRLLAEEVVWLRRARCGAWPPATPYPGDKVIQTKNDYELGVMNGAMGIVLDAEPDGGLTIDFDGRPWRSAAAMRSAISNWPMRPRSTKCRDRSSPARSSSRISRIPSCTTAICSTRR